MSMQSRSAEDDILHLAEELLSDIQAGAEDYGQQARLSAGIEFVKNDIQERVPIDLLQAIEIILKKRSEAMLCKVKGPSWKIVGGRRAK